jgi:hypothetical protein
MTGVREFLILNTGAYRPVETQRFYTGSAIPASFQ